MKQWVLLILALFFLGAHMGALANEDEQEADKASAREPVSIAEGQVEPEDLMYI